MSAKSGEDQDSTRLNRIIVFERFFQRVIGASLVILFGCENDFNPVATFEPKLVVYSVLSSASHTQYIRVYTSFDPSTSSLGSFVADATVQVNKGSTVYTFKDTTLQGADSTAFRSPVRLYYNPSMQPQKDEVYSLVVSSPTYGSATAMTIIPGAAFLLINYEKVLADPRAEGPNHDLAVTINLSPSAKSFVVRLFVYFIAETRTVPSYDQEERVEVPVLIREISRVRDEYEYFYPKPQRRVNQSSIYHEGFGYHWWAYYKTVRDIQYNYLNVRFSRAVFYLVQFDEAFYKYYALANLYRDFSSVRLDEPDFTNIVGGVGLFGSLSVDSVTSVLPERIPVEF